MLSLKPAVCGYVLKKHKPRILSNFPEKLAKLYICTMHLLLQSEMWVREFWEKPPRW